MLALLGLNWDGHAVTYQAVPVARLCDAQTETQEATKGGPELEVSKLKIYDDPYQDPSNYKIRTNSLNFSEVVLRDFLKPANRIDVLA